MDGELWRRCMNVDRAMMTRCGGARIEGFKCYCLLMMAVVDADSAGLRTQRAEERGGRGRE